MGEKAQRKPRAANGSQPRAGSRAARSLWPRIAELRAQGRTVAEISEEIGRGPSQVSRTLAEPSVQAEIERIQADRRKALEQEIRADAVMAWSVMRSLASDPEVKDEVRARAAADILDRAGIVARKAVEVTGANGGPVAVVSLTPEQLAGMSADQLRALAAVAIAESEGGP